jgi:proteasome lid subunit RPN8/RPN11
MKRKISQSEVAAQNANVLIDKAAVSKINEMIYKDPKHECGGIFLGNVAKDAVTGKYTVHVQDLYVEDRIGTGSTFEFTTDYLMNAVKHVKKHCPDVHIIGNVHSHAQYQAFWSGVDREMMLQARENCFYMVVSPKYGTWEAVFKDMDFGFHKCDVRIADKNACAHMFDRCMTRKDSVYEAAGKKVKASTFHTTRYYTDVQRKELDKRFLHSIKNLEDKKVLIVGAGTIGNLLTEYAINSGVGNLTIVDMDAYEYWNLPRSSMVGADSLRKPKALELAKAAAERSSFSVKVTGINANICDLGWGFFKDFDLVLSPVDSAAVRQYVDRGCKLYHIPHITCGTGDVDGEFTGNVVSFPADASVDLEYVWGNGYRKNLEERRSCSDMPEETQAQVMGFSAQIAGMAMDLALKYLLGKTQDAKTAWKYVLSSVGNGFDRDKAALRTFKYSRLPEQTPSELYDTLAEAGEIKHIEFDRTHPKGELWDKFSEAFREDISSYRLNLEWGLNIPVAYRSTDAYAKIEVPKACGVDPVLLQLPKEHIYLVEGDEGDYLAELCFVDESDKK